MSGLAYQPYGGAEKFFYDRSDEVLLSGPAGTGKSRACLEKLHLCMLKYPGARGLIVRQTRVSLTESALVTFEEKVLPAGSKIATSVGRENRRLYRYPNGSEIVVGGLDRPSRVLSTEYDLIYVQEAIELKDEGWEVLLTRLRNGVMPYQQMIADTNPGPPSHWLKQRANGGAVRLIESRHEDNPVYWDRGGGDWTPAGRLYIAKLDRLTGARKQRLRYGKWVQAEGQVYEEWDSGVHVVPRKVVQPEWPAVWGVDFGFTNPFVWEDWREDPDGRLYLYQEIYRTGRIVADLAGDIAVVTVDSPPPWAIVCDHDAEDRATLEKALGRKTLAAHKRVSPGIQAVKKRLKVADDGKPRLFVCEGALLYRDAAREDARLPCGFRDEVDGYVWDRGVGSGKDAPVKVDDHSMDTARYVVAYVDKLGRREMRAY